MNKPTIPKIIHQIWIGEDMPQSIMIAMKSIKDSNPNYKYYLWTDKDIAEFNLHDSYKNYSNVRLANELKFKILTIYGGWYVDADMMSSTPIESLPSIFLESDICSSTDSSEPSSNSNSVIGCLRNTDFSLLLKYYMETSSTSVKPHWKRWCREQNVLKIPLELIGFGPKTVFRDLRLKTWHNEVIKTEVKQSNTHFLGSDRDVLPLDIREVKLLEDVGNHKQTKNKFYKKSYK